MSDALKKTLKKSHLLANAVNLYNLIQWYTKKCARHRGCQIREIKNDNQFLTK